MTRHSGRAAAGEASTDGRYKWVGGTEPLWAQRRRAGELESRLSFLGVMSDPCQLLLEDRACAPPLLQSGGRRRVLDVSERDASGGLEGKEEGIDGGQAHRGGHVCASVDPFGQGGRPRDARERISAISTLQTAGERACQADAFSCDELHGAAAA